MKSILVDRLWSSYAWPECGLPMRGMTLAKLRQYKPQPRYVSGDARTLRRPSRAWDYGRIRHFVERLSRGEPLDPIDVDNVCDNGRVYPEPILLDGHHRLAASHLFGTERIAARYGGRVDLLHWLSGRRKTRPTS